MERPSVLNVPLKRLRASSDSKRARAADLTYATSDDPLLKRWTIRAIETASGRNALLPLYDEWRRNREREPERQMTNMLELLDIELRFNKRDWKPELSDEEPVVVIANHPFGIGDGAAALSVAEQLGRPYKVLIHKGLLNVPEVPPIALPVDFDETKLAARTNIATKKAALDCLANGTTIVIFPAGGVATATRPFGRAEELPWKNFTARLIQSSRASVLPMYFEGQNGPLFHIATKLSMTLRTSLLVSEVGRMRGATIHVNVGDLIRFSELSNPDDRRQLIAELHDRVFSLGVHAKWSRRGVRASRRRRREIKRKRKAG